MTAAAKVIEEIRTMVKGDGPPDSATPAALHVGSERAHWLISDAAGWRSNRLSALFGLPIVVGSAQAPPLGDHGWRLLNGAGAVIAEGEISDP